MRILFFIYFKSNQAGVLFLNDGCAGNVRVAESFGQISGIIIAAGFPRKRSELQMRLRMFNCMIRGAAGR